MALCSEFQSIPLCLQKLASSEATTLRGSAGDIAERSTQLRSTGDPVTNRHAISAETGWPRL